MISAIDIFSEVEANTAALNGEIVRRALHGRCCGFIENQSLFAELLSDYSMYRGEIHRLNKRLNGGYFDRPRVWKPGDYDRLHTHQWMAADLRKRMQNCWPCAACIWLYNPTKKTRRRFPQLC